MTECIHFHFLVAIEKLDAMMSSPTAWESQYRIIADVDDMKVPECGESFMTLMLTMTGRIIFFTLSCFHHRL